MHERELTQAELDMYAGLRQLNREIFEDKQMTPTQDDYGRVECRIDYSRGRARMMSRNFEGRLPIVHRTDYHEDGSQSEYFYLELSEEQFKKLTDV